MTLQERQSTMIIDTDRHVAVTDYRDVLAYLDKSWQKHFERKEFLGSVTEASNHIRVSSRFGEQPVSAAALPEADKVLLMPHQALTVNGWADGVAATEFLSGFNSLARDKWSSGNNVPVIVVQPGDPGWSAAEIRRRAAEHVFGAIALPLGAGLLGASHYDQIYEAAAETGLAIIVHFSGVEGLYAGAQPLGGGVHYSALSRQVLMSQLAESNITSLAFEGTLEKFPAVRFLFSGFGFSWLPSMLWRIDREWRTFRYDVPWVKHAPSKYVLEQVWLNTWPLKEATMDGDWARHFTTDALRSRIVFGSHSPFDGDAPGDVIKQLGPDDGALILSNGAALLPRVEAVTS